jgi:predicted kinase
VLPARQLFVVVSGPPGSGKSTLAGPLAERLQLPLLAKDTIKDALMTVLPVPDVAASRALGHAAVVAMLASAAASPIGAVLDSNFSRSAAATELGALPGTIVEVFCRCPRDEAKRRYAARTGTRHAGHFDAQRDPADLWNEDTSQPVAGGWPVLEVDTTGPIDLEWIAAFVDTSASRVKGGD